MRCRVIFVFVIEDFHFTIAEIVKGIILYIYIIIIIEGVSGGEGKKGIVVKRNSRVRMLEA